MLLITGKTLDDRYVVMDYNLEKPYICATMQMLTKNSLLELYKGRHCENFSVKEKLVLPPENVLNIFPTIINSEIVEPKILDVNNEYHMGNLIYTLYKAGYVFKGQSLTNLDVSLSTGSLYMRVKEEDGFKTYNITKYKYYKELELLPCKFENHIASNVINIDSGSKFNLDNSYMDGLFSIDLLGYLINIYNLYKMYENAESALSYEINKKEYLRKDNSSSKRMNYNSLSITAPIPTVQDLKIACVDAFKKETIEFHFGDRMNDILKQQIKAYKDNGQFLELEGEVRLKTVLWIHELMYNLNNNPSLFIRTGNVSTTFQDLKLKRGV